MQSLFCNVSDSLPAHAVLSQEKFRPVKYFSIDRVFRNESLDATHLAEFHQIEGVIADYNLTLADLIGVLHAFFKKLGEFICQGHELVHISQLNFDCFILLSD